MDNKIQIYNKLNNHRKKIIYGLSIIVSAVTINAKANYFAVPHVLGVKTNLDFWNRKAANNTIKYYIPSYSFSNVNMILQSYSKSQKQGLYKQRVFIKKELSKMKTFHVMNQVSKKEGICCSVTEGKSLPAEWRRGGHIGGKINGKIFIAGGNQWNIEKTQKYWLKSSAIFSKGIWITGPDLPKPIAYAMFAYDNTGIYVAGGTTDGIDVSDEVYRLRSTTNRQKYEQLPNLPEPVSYGAGAILNGRFYVACGFVGKENSNRMSMLNISDKESNWQQCAIIPGVKRILPSLVACGKYLYLFGGLAQFTPLTALSDAYRYDPENNLWTKLPDLPMKGYAWTSQPIDDEHILITGKADGIVSNGIWVINLMDMSMDRAGDLISAASTSPLINVTKKEWWLVGGEPDSQKNRTEKVSIIKIK